MPKDDYKQLSQRISEVDTLLKMDNKTFETYVRVVNTCLHKLNELEARIQELENAKS